MLIPKPLILFIDAYDSFSNNIISLLETVLCASILTIKTDHPLLLSSPEALHGELRHYAAVVCGPGPGHPGKEGDVGIMRKIWKLRDEEMLPVLGICLGFQSLCAEFGGRVGRLKGPQHGMIRRLTHVEEVAGEGRDGIFRGTGVLHATLYQSLCVDIGQDDIADEAWEGEKWRSQRLCPDLVPLAWVESTSASKEYNESCGVKDDRVLVAVQHRTKPFWALQYHPESVCTDDESKKVIKNWFRHAQLWNRRTGRRQNFGVPLHGQSAIRESLLSQYERLRLSQENVADVNSSQLTYMSRTIDLPDHISVPDIVEAVGDSSGDQIILESSNANDTSIGTAAVRGRYSIIALEVSNCSRFQYRVGNSHITLISSEIELCKGCHTIDLQPYGGIWPFLAQHLEKRRILDGNPDSPFWGGFMGYTTYELGLEGIDAQIGTRKHSHRPDLSFAWVTRSIVVDHVKKAIYIQQIQEPDEEEENKKWIDEMTGKLRQLSYIPQNPQEERNTAESSITNKCTINQPSNQSYEQKVLICQEKIRSGDSYELCLTDQTTIALPSSSPSPSNSSATQSNPPPTPWQLYTSLRHAQPSPFTSYIHLNTLTFLSSSPERFLSYTSTGKCILRPMKGTIRKSPSVPSLAAAKKLLQIPKEKAENLMIVDLVRHDLSAICGTGVSVKEGGLMKVEEFRSVWQMSSVVEGDFSGTTTEEDGENSRREGGRYTGLDILAASLPPGSMTGAPKKRSCEILKEIEEGKERSLYSGVVGYMDVAGRGDWSVNIRCLYRWDDEFVGSDGDVEGEGVTEKWHVGAGGAVTALSTPVGEREEMRTKLSGLLGIFQ